MKNWFITFIRSIVGYFFDFCDFVGDGVRANINTNFLQDLAAIVSFLESTLSGFCLFYGSAKIMKVCDITLTLVLVLNILIALSCLTDRSRRRYVSILLAIFAGIALFNYLLELGECPLPEMAVSYALTSTALVVIGEILAYKEITNIRIKIKKVAILKVVCVIYVIGIFGGLMASQFRPKKYDSSPRLNYIEVAVAELSDPLFLKEYKDSKADYIEEKFGVRPEKVAVWFVNNKSCTYFKMSDDDTWYWHQDSAEGAIW